ncbi:MAG: 8-amino-7-oxononanoate synthase [Pseudomonadota bacterium]
MTDSPLQAFDDALAELDAAGLRRRRRVVEAIDGPRLHIDGRWLLSFCSNDYLGLSQHPALIAAAQAAAGRYGVGAGASPMVSGHSTEHERLEEELAAFVGRERALYFYAGYPANVGIVPALVGRGDAVFSDALNHACLIDGARLSRAEIHAYPHADLAALARLLAASSAQRKLVISDAVFSMDGDIAPVPELLALCERHDAYLMVDDAHGFGVLGPDGRGTAAHFGLASPRLIYMATLGKAAGVAGAFVAGDAPVIEWILQRARSYMFATGAPAMVAATLRASLTVIEAEGWRREQLRQHIAQLRAGLAGLPWTLLPSDTAIQPLIVGSNTDALALMQRLQDAGLWVPAIRPPTVPANTARLRIALSAVHTEADVDALLAALKAAAG